MLIQNIQGEQLAFIYNLPPKEKFVDFVEFNNYKDLDFNMHSFKKCMGHLNAEMCSTFVFLTEKKSPKGQPILMVNVFIVNSYGS